MIKAGTPLYIADGGKIQTNIASGYSVVFLGYAGEDMSIISGFISEWPPLHLCSGAIVSGSIASGQISFSNFPVGSGTISSHGPILTSDSDRSYSVPPSWQDQARERGIREALGFLESVPSEIIADYLENRGRNEAADFMRSRK